MQAQDNEEQAMQLSQERNEKPAAAIGKIHIITTIISYQGLTFLVENCGAVSPSVSANFSRANTLLDNVNARNTIGANVIFIRFVPPFEKCYMRCQYHALAN